MQVDSAHVTAAAAIAVAAASEIMGLNPKTRDNSIIQLVLRVLFLIFPSRK